MGRWHLSDIELIAFSAPQFCSSISRAHMIDFNRACWMQPFPVVSRTWLLLFDFRGRDERLVEERVLTILPALSIVQRSVRLYARDPGNSHQGAHAASGRIL